MDTSALTEIQSIVINAARQAGEILRKNWGQAGQIEHKGAIDLVTETDRLAEAAILTTLQAHYPDFSILAEEAGQRGDNAEQRFIVDPLDGTTNYAHAYPCFCVSIALEQQGVVTLGVIYEPLLDELYTAIKGQGAYVNGKPLFVSATNNLNDSLLVTGFPYNIRERTGNSLKYFNHLALLAQGVRRDGSAALDLCYVAAGRYDGFWELNLCPWDVAAGSLIVAEAGGRVSHIDDVGFSINGKQILATNGLIHEELGQALKQAAKSN